MTELVKGPSASVLTKCPPAHPHWRCRIVAKEETVELPVMVQRPDFAKDTPVQRELEKWYRALTPKEIENRIKAHMGSS